MSKAKGRMLFYCAGSLVDHVSRDCGALRARIEDRGHRGNPADTDGVRQRYITGRSYIPLCAVCAPEPPAPRRRTWRGRVWPHGGKVVIWADPAEGAIRAHPAVVRALRHNAASRP